MLTRRYRDGALTRSRTLRRSTLQNVRNLALQGIDATIADMRWMICLASLRSSLSHMNETTELDQILAALERINASLDARLAVPAEPESTTV